MVTEKEVIYRSELCFTPLLAENRIDVQKCIRAVMVAMLIASKIVPKNCT
ncbi:MAG: ethanolamine ammonia-lyase reactivating factor EutA [Paenibacillus sp.]|nr:ethanolamine ammonia-lyase reactivating factor EutA [Paenibacillus sp.]